MSSLRKPFFSSYPVEVKRKKLIAELNGCTVQPELSQRCVDFALEYDLQPRDMKTLVLCIQGKTHMQIALETHYHPQAVQSRIRDILKKSGCNSKIQLAFKVLWYAEPLNDNR